ncbi:OB-fold domain-containing protein [Mesorhizobium sp. CAU 1741]|uniref:Zn-ribbon domain-containing OB-fold protein n=1 Tax=Mesorhizobium sp. CAU 1741 TaxID=3140366 RepID=UPI00325B07EB
MSFPAPEITDVNRPYWEGLAEGSLRYKHCLKCDSDWLPARSHCPHCLSDKTEWRASAGRGKVVSWIVYRKAYAPHLESKVPYDVTIVELEEGPRLLTNVVDSEAGQKLAVGTAVALAIQEEEGFHLPRFRLAEGGDMAQA